MKHHNLLIVLGFILVVLATVILSRSSLKASLGNMGASSSTSYDAGSTNATTSLASSDMTTGYTPSTDPSAVAGGITVNPPKPTLQNKPAPCGGYPNCGGTCEKGKTCTLGKSSCSCK